MVFYGTIKFMSSGAIFREIELDSVNRLARGDHWIFILTRSLMCEILALSSKGGGT